MGKKMEPIRKLETEHDIEVTLSRLDSMRGERMFIMWVVGVNLGLRIGDLVKMKVGDLRGQSTYTFVPEKTKHTKRNPQPVTITIPRIVRTVLAARCQDMADGDWLLPSRKRTPGGNPKHITRQTALNDIKEIGQLCKVKMPMGCHTMRKTFGYHYYKKHKDVAKLQKWFDHSDPSVTLIYIGIAEDELREMTDDNPFDNMDGLQL